MIKFALISILLFSPLNAMDFEFVEEILPIRQIDPSELVIFEHVFGGLYIITPNNCYFLPVLKEPSPPL